MEEKYVNNDSWVEKGQRKGQCKNDQEIQEIVSGHKANEQMVATQ